MNNDNQFQPPEESDGHLKIKQQIDCATAQVLMARVKEGEQLHEQNVANVILHALSCENCIHVYEALGKE